MQKINSMNLKFISMKIFIQNNQNSNMNTVHKGVINMIVQKEEKREFRANKANRNKNNIKEVFTRFSLDYLKHLKCDFLPFFTAVYSFFLINIFLFRFFNKKNHKKSLNFVYPTNYKNNFLRL